MCRSRLSSVMLVLTLFAMTAIAEDKATQQVERTVIEQRAKSYAAAYNAKDLKALMAHWAPEGAYIDRASCH